MMQKNVAIKPFTNTAIKSKPYTFFPVLGWNFLLLETFHLALIQKTNKKTPLDSTVGSTEGIQTLLYLYTFLLFFQ